MSQRNQHLTHTMLRKSATRTPKQFQTSWCFGKDSQHAGGQAGLHNLQSATVFFGILPSRYTCKSIAFCQSCAKGYCSISFSLHVPEVNWGGPLLRFSKANVFRALKMRCCSDFFAEVSSYPKFSRIRTSLKILDCSDAIFWKGACHAVSPSWLSWYGVTLVGWTGCWWWFDSPQVRE